MASLSPQHALSHYARTIGRFSASLVLFSCLATVSAQTTNTNTVTNGGLINVGDTEIITNTVASPISVAITNDGSVQFWQTTALTVSGEISGSGSLTKASGSGNLTLSGANSFGGKVTVLSRRWIANSVADSGTSALATKNQLEMGSGTALQIDVASGADNTTRQLIVNGNFSLANNGNGALVWNGNLVNNSVGNNAFLFNSGAGISMDRVIQQRLPTGPPRRFV